jgi:phosphatidylinositol glycan class N
MAIRFFYQITTVGSWADIGHSISRYALMGTQVVSILLFLGVADVFTRALPINGVCAVTARARSKKRN